MAIKCGWASQDERGKASGGKAGDQTGREVKVGNWYSFGQNVVLRFKDRDKAKKAAACMKDLCEKNYVGYDQSQRTTLWDKLKALKWNYKKLKTPVETDCSALIAVCVNAAGIKISKNCWTGNLKAACKETGEFTVLIDKKYITSDKYLKVGDIILNEKAHVIMALEDGASANSSSTSKKSGTKQKYGGTFPTLPSRGYFEKGDEGLQVKRLQRFLNWYLDGSLSVDGSYGPKTVEAVKAFQRKCSLTVDGSFGKSSLAKAKTVKK